MRSSLNSRWSIGAIVAVCALSAAPTANARDFFTSLFGAFSDNPALGSLQQGRSGAPLPFAAEGDSFGRPNADPAARPRYSGGSQAYCVRTCDGRYFPIAATDGQSRAASCNSFCPASDTKVYYGSTIDHASTENGKSYSDLPNAFRYRSELVAGCTCNGKDQIGLAPIKIEDDKTVRRGDIVAGPGGLMVAGRSADKRGASLNMLPAAASVRAKYERVPVLASE